jgi:L-alanine-DL-glutamate epimerase-like enolase superfamily enzyme
MGERLIVNASQDWDLTDACRMAPRLAEFGLSWIEEPLMADRPLGEWIQVAAAAPALSRRRSSPALLEVDANANPLREGLLGDVFVVRDGHVSLPGGQGLGLEPDIKEFVRLRNLHLERRA